MAEEIRRQQFGSENEAFGFLVESIVGKLDDDPEQQAEMKKFLELLLETDPELRDEIKRTVSIRS